ncbi:MAG: hypothetical protein AB7L13_18470 [Acidimicrobiia bacterium]
MKRLLIVGVSALAASGALGACGADGPAGNQPGSGPATTIPTTTMPAAAATTGSGAGVYGY